MNKNKLRNIRKSTKNSPVLFEDEDMCTSSPDEVRSVKSVKYRSSLSGHSTPLRHNIKTDCSDSPELNYDESPIEPLTQHPPNEVGWDYKGTGIKEEDSKSLASMEIIKTPKRNAALLSKKRNSNSPLLYKPLKKKLIQEEQQESMAGFMAELKAIEIKAKQIGEKNVEVQNENYQDSPLIINMDSEPSSDSDIKLQVSANTDDSPMQNKLIAINKNELLDDSIEDMLVLCSQQVEAKEFGIKSGQMIVDTSSEFCQENVSRQSSSNSGNPVKNLHKENLNPLNNDNQSSSNSSNKYSSSKDKSNSLEIPNDSFDDFVVEFDDNDFYKNSKNIVVIDSVNKSTKSCVNKSNTKFVTSTVTSSNSVSSQNKFFSSKSSICINQTKIISSRSNSTDCEMTNASIQNKIVNSKANFGYLNQDYKKNQNSSNFTSQNQTSNDTRLFKSKSYSDSNFFNQSSSGNNLNQNSRSYSGMETHAAEKHLNNKSEQSSSWRRVHSSSSLSVNNNSQLGPRMSSSEGSLHTSCTPAEIEKKRQEAILKQKALKQMRENARQKRPLKH